MQKVVIDAATRAKLGPLVGQVALADEAGNTLAYVLPPDLYHRLTAGWDESEPTPEERAAAREEYRRSGGLTTAEAIAFVRGGPAG
jgi:hypothetical protein